MNLSYIFYKLLLFLFYLILLSLFLLFFLLALKLNLSDLLVKLASKLILQRVCNFLG